MEKTASLQLTVLTHLDHDSEMLAQSSYHHMNTLHVTQHRKCAESEGKSDLECKEPEAILQKVCLPIRHEIVNGRFAS